MTAVNVNTYTHSVTYVSDNILKSFKDIIRLSGLDPSGITADWHVLMRGLETWIDTGHLNKIVLEIFNPRTGELVVRWDIDIVYGWSGDGGFWTDTEQLKYHIKKAGLAPNSVAYRIVVENKAGHPSVEGWSSTDFRSTDGFVRQSLGATISHNGLEAGAAYWRRG